MRWLDKLRKKATSDLQPGPCRWQRVLLEKRLWLREKLLQTPWLCGRLPKALALGVPLVLYLLAEWTQREDLAVAAVVSFPIAMGICGIWFGLREHPLTMMAACASWGVLFVLSVAMISGHVAHHTFGADMTVSDGLYYWALAVGWQCFTSGMFCVAMLDWLAIFDPAPRAVIVLRTQRLITVLAIATAIVVALSVQFLAAAI